MYDDYPGKLVTEDYLRALIQHIDKTNELLKAVLLLVSAIFFFLIGSRFGWF